LTPARPLEAVARRKLDIVFVKRAASFAKFAPEKMTKATLAHGESLFAGLNSFEPGQEHALHSHEGQEKLYLVLEGSAMVRIGEQTEHLTAGDAASAPSGVIHSIRNPGPERLVVVVVLAPPPHK
jgi:quercetin dioxygenase-like cupin family protein